MKGTLWRLCLKVFFLFYVVFVGKGYLKKLETDPDAVVNLGDSTYYRSIIKSDLGIGLPRPLPKDGVQQKELFFFPVFFLSDCLLLLGGEGGSCDCKS
jgi:hypothetical protein